MAQSHKTYDVSLSPLALRILYTEVYAATDGDRTQRRHLDKAHQELSDILDARTKLGGEVTFNRWGDLMKSGETVHTFSQSAIVGMKIALVQALAGVQDRRLKANLGTRLDLLRVASAFGGKFLAAVKRDTKLDEDEFDDVDDKLEDLMDSSDADTPEQEKKEA